MVKTIDEYMKLPYRMEIVEDADEGGYVVSFPELRGCLTCGQTAEKALAAAGEAKRAWLEAALEDGYPIPEPRLEQDWSGQFKLNLPKQLHRQLSEHARQEGISINQYCLYLLTKNDTVYALEHRG